MIFTEEQVKNINEFQKSGVMHPFTCGNCGATLVATNDGLICPTEGCGYTQDWCHGFMADGSAVALAAKHPFPSHPVAGKTAEAPK